MQPSALVQPQHQAVPVRDAGPRLRAPQAPQARLSGAELRELSAQWRQRAGEDPEKAHRIADALEWLAAHRDAATRAPSLIERLRAGISRSLSSGR
ncbi:hypothetical protein ACIPRI_20985 [Variovorax sp. LARHSF232]